MNHEGHEEIEGHEEVFVVFDLLRGLRGSKNAYGTVGVERLTDSACPTINSCA